MWTNPERFGFQWVFRYSSIQRSNSLIQRSIRISKHSSCHEDFLGRTIISHSTVHFSIGAPCRIPLVLVVFNDYRTILLLNGPILSFRTLPTSRPSFYPNNQHFRQKCHFCTTRMPWKVCQHAKIHFSTVNLVALLYPNIHHLRYKCRL